VRRDECVFDFDRKFEWELDFDFYRAVRWRNCGEYDKQHELEFESGGAMKKNSITMIVFLLCPVAFAQSLGTTKGYYSATQIDSMFQFNDWQTLFTATNSFDALGAAKAATNGYPWGSLYQPMLTYQPATNGASIALTQLPYVPQPAAPNLTNWSNIATNQFLGTNVLPALTNQFQTTNINLSQWSNIGTNKFAPTNLASATVSGILFSNDWSSFNSKLTPAQTTNAASAVTNGYPWGSLYDATGAAHAATNNLIITATNLANGGSSVGQILTATTSGVKWSNAPSGGSGVTNLATILATGPNPGNMAGQTISNGFFVNGMVSNAILVASGASPAGQVFSTGDIYGASDLYLNKGVYPIAPNDKNHPFIAFAETGGFGIGRLDFYTYGPPNAGGYPQKYPSVRWEARDQGNYTGVHSFWVNEGGGANDSYLVEVMDIISANDGAVGNGYYGLLMIDDGTSHCTILGSDSQPAVDPLNRQLQAGGGNMVLDWSANLDGSVILVANNGSFNDPDVGVYRDLKLGGGGGMATDGSIKVLNGTFYSSNQVTVANIKAGMTNGDFWVGTISNSLMCFWMSNNVIQFKRIAP
jgi:hypothetical protein